jgi:hypothetical protein
VHIANFPASLLQQRDPEAPFILGGLLKYENKMSVTNFTLQKHSSYKEPIKAKVFETRSFTSL